MTQPGDAPANRRGEILDGALTLGEDADQLG